MKKNKLKIKNKIKQEHFLNKMFLFFGLFFLIFNNFSFKVFAEENLVLENTDVLTDENQEVVEALVKENLDKSEKVEDLNLSEDQERIVEDSVENSTKIEETENFEVVENGDVVEGENIKVEEFVKDEVEEIDYSETKIRINEILPSANNTYCEKEFVEIYNYSDKEISLLGWTLKSETSSREIKLDSLKPKEFFAIESSRFLIDSGTVILLLDENNNEIDRYQYSQLKGQSWNYSENEWYPATPTPNEENLKKPVPKDYSKTKIRINEVLADPNESETEFIELYNYGNEEIDLTSWALKDETDNKSEFKNIKIKSGEKIAFLKGKNFSFALNNSGGETVYLIDPNGDLFIEKSYSTSTKGLSLNFDENKWYEAIPTPNAENLENSTTKNYPKIRINEIFPNAIGSDEGQEFIEFYNPNDETVELKNWKLEYVAKNKNSGSETKREFIFSDEKIEKNNFLVLTNKDNNPIFDLRNNSNDGDVVTLTLVSPNPNIKFGISYEETIEGQSYNYDDKNWYWAKTTPNIENKENPLTKNYPNLILSEILPNPIGDEATEEFIEIYNPNDFEVNLESWILKDSSTSGNYIFNENQKVSAKSYFTIYRKDFDFALNNSGGEKIYLVSPNQKIQSQTEYQSAKENLSYNFDLENKNWRWSKFLTPNAKNIFNNLPEIENFSVDKKVYRDVYANFEVKASDLDDDELKITWDFGDGHKSYKAETSHKYLKTGTFQASLKIYDGSEEVIKNFEIKVKKYPKYDLEIVKIVPNPKGLDSLNEYIVIKNKSDEKIDLKGWSVATGSDKDKIYNHPIRESLTIKDEKEEVVTRKYSAFSLPNKKGYVELRQPDGRVVSKVFYEKDKIQNDESYEKIGKEWRWVSANNLDDPEVQKIIAQALENEKKWQAETFEQKIAEKIVHQEMESKSEAGIKKSFWLSEFLEKINLFLNKNVPAFNGFLATIFRENYLVWLKNKVIAFNKNRNFVLDKNFFEIEKIV